MGSRQWRTQLAEITKPLQATEGMPASSAAVIKSRIFVTKLDQQVTVAGLKEYVKELTGSVCEIEKLEVRGSNFFYLLQ